MERFDSEQQSYPTLLKFGTDLTAMATMGKLDPTIGRHVELERLTQVLSRRRKNNACLVGHPGVGKTVVVEGLAVKIANGTAPKSMIGKKVFSIDMARLVGGATFQGEFEARMVALIDEVVKSKGSVILFIDELHSLIAARGVGKALNAANILKPALARGDLKCIGATTFDEYKEYIDGDAALKRRFQRIDVPEPSPEEAVEILKGLRGKYEAHHGVSYADAVLDAAVDLSKQYVSDRYLPDKAVDLIDEAGARVNLRKRKSPCSSCSPSTPAPPVTKADIQQVISTWTGIPLENLSAKESATLLTLENSLNAHVIGQDEAVSAVSRAIRRARVGLRDTTRPVASFLFTGPTGVGKTELAKALASECFGSKEAMVRLDMSEYAESHSASRMIGAPPGYVGHDEGGQLTEAVKRKPHTVFLFDEVEKAHPKVFDVLLQVMGDGALTDGKGARVDFKHTVLIFTANVVGEDVGAKLREIFKPEFLNRLDEVVVFRGLEKGDLGRIVEVMLVEVCGRAEKIGVHVEVGEGLKGKLVEEGFGGGARYGARPLRRAVTRLVEDKLAESVLNGSVSEGHRVKMDVDEQNGQVVITHLQVLDFVLLN